MKLFRKRRKLNNKGLSLVELVCAIAIFSIALTAIGSAMVVSAQSYSKGTYELDVQQEAQTTTNLIGNLIVDAVTATYDESVPDRPVLVVNNAKNEYVITYDKAAQTLEYQEENLTTGAIANGVLAVNVTDFDVDLADFASNNSVEVSLEVEKNGRVYEASYNTTSRNGDSDSTGIAEVASILVESEVILEPGQNYDIPITVVGTAPNKQLSVGSLTAAPGSEVGGSVCSFDSANSVLSITVGTNAKGALSIPIATIMVDDAGAPLATATVTVKVRRVNSLTSPQDADNDDVADDSALKSGSAYQNGAVYRIEFQRNGTYFAKAVGKVYDMDYIDPTTVDYDISITSGYNAADYFSVLNKVYTKTDLVDNAYVDIQLTRDLPVGVEISVKATSKHATGTNKTGTAYDNSVTKTVVIKKEFSPFGDADINRGNDGTHQISVDSAYMQQLINLYGDRYKKIIEVYEATYNADGTITRGAFAYAGQSVDGGNDTNIRPLDTKKMRPDKAYIMVVRLEFYDASNNVIWPVAGTDPSLYMREYPLTKTAFTYQYHEEGKGIKTSPYTMQKNAMNDYIYVECTGLDMSRHKDRVNFIVEKWNGSDYVEYTGGKEVGFMEGHEDGTARMKLKIQDTGDFRIRAVLINYPYLAYDETDVNNNIYGDFVLNDTSTGEGILYLYLTE